MQFRLKDRTMKPYKFFSRKDTTQEGYQKYMASSKVEAVEYFAKMKELSVEAFLKIYDVVEID